jgi:hypothetical protein
VSDKPNYSGLIVVALLFWFSQQSGAIGPHQKPSVFIAIESNEKSSLPAGMVNSWGSAKVRQHSATNWDDFLVIDRSVIEGGSEPEHAKYRDVLKQHPPKRLPCLYVSNGKHGASGDPPLSEDELIAIGKKYE